MLKLRTAALLVRGDSVVFTVISFIQIILFYFILSKALKSVQSKHTALSIWRLTDLFKSPMLSVYFK